MVLREEEKGEDHEELTRDHQRQYSGSLKKPWDEAGRLETDTEMKGEDALQDGQTRLSNQVLRYVGLLYNTLHNLNVELGMLLFVSVTIKERYITVTIGLDADFKTAVLRLLTKTTRLSSAVTTSLTLPTDVTSTFALNWGWFLDSCVLS